MYFSNVFLSSAEKIKTTRKHKAAPPRFVLQRALRPKSVSAHKKGGAVRSVASRTGVKALLSDFDYIQRRTNLVTAWCIFSHHVYFITIGYELWEKHFSFCAEPWALNLSSLDFMSHWISHCLFKWMKTISFLLSFPFAQLEPKCGFPAAHCLLSAQSEPGPSEGAVRPLGTCVTSLLSTAEVRLSFAPNTFFSPRNKKDKQLMLLGFSLWCWLAVSL